MGKPTYGRVQSTAESAHHHQRHSLLNRTRGVTTSSSASSFLANKGFSLTSQVYNIMFLRVRRFRSHHHPHNIAIIVKRRASHPTVEEHHPQAQTYYNNHFFYFLSRVHILSELFTQRALCTTYSSPSTSFGWSSSAASLNESLAVLS